MKIKEIIVNNVQGNHHEIFPCIKGGNIEIENIKKLNNLGFNITYSPRFLCVARSSISEKCKSTVFIKCKYDVEKEYKNMKMLWRTHYFNSEKYIIPKPLFIDSINKMLFLECIKGEVFLKGFYKSGAKKEKIRILQNRIIAVANWLVDFQNIYCSSEKSSLAEEIPDYKNNVENIRGLKDVQKKEIISKMHSIIGGFPKYSKTFTHGHFLIRNIIFLKNEEKICVVDFPKLTIGWPFYDFLTFVTCIDKLELYPFFTREICGHLKESFIYEYTRKSNIEYNKELFENLWVFYIINNLRKRYQNYKGIRIKGFGNEFFARKILKRVISWSKN